MPPRSTPPPGDRDASGEGDELRLVLIRTFASALEADMARVFLDAQGIPAIVQGDDAGGMQPALGWSHGVRLYVRWVDAIAAGAVLDAEPATDPDGGPWDDEGGGGDDDDGDDGADRVASRG